MSNIFNTPEKQINEVIRILNCHSLSDEEFILENQLNPTNQLATDHYQCIKLLKDTLQSIKDSINIESEKAFNAAKDIKLNHNYKSTGMPLYLNYKHYRSENPL